MSDIDFTKPLTPWQIVQVARMSGRPLIGDYI